MATRRRETRVERRVRKALKKYVRKARRTNRSGEKKRLARMKREGWTPRVAVGHTRARARALGATWVPAKKNPPRVKGRKVKGGRAVTLRKFTGTIVRKKDGTVEILGRGRK